jgi:hypothetical protein
MTVGKVPNGHTKLYAYPLEKMLHTHYPSWM